MTDTEFFQLVESVAIAYWTERPAEYQRQLLADLDAAIHERRHERCVCGRLVDVHALEHVD